MFPKSLNILNFREISDKNPILFNIFCLPKYVHVRTYINVLTKIIIIYIILISILLNTLVLNLDILLFGFSTTIFTI